MMEDLIIEDGKQITTNRLKISELSTPLEADYLEYKPKTIIAYGDAVYAIILAFKDARVDMQVLDNTVGAGNWQNAYKRDEKGILQCGIGIWVDDREDWVWKWSNGTPSNFEKEKGEYSDALKRAGYLWGIGRTLYDFPPIKIQLQDREFKERDRGGYEATGFLKPNNWNWEVWIDYETGSYEHVVVSDKKGNIRYNMNPHKKKFQDPKNQQIRP